jgi:hypothetical protein
VGRGHARICPAAPGSDAQAEPDRWLCVAGAAAPALAGLNGAESDDGRRIRALLRWHGSGSGRCSGYPVHQGAPEELLLDEIPGALLTVVSAPDLTAAETAGAARLVASWPARHRSEFNRLPLATWDRLTAAVAVGGDRTSALALRAAVRTRRQPTGVNRADTAPP